MKKTLLFGLQFFILFILLFLMIITGVAITYIGSNWTPGSESIFTVVFANLPDILMRSVIPALTFGIFITHFRNIKNRNISFGQAAIMFLLSYLIMAFGTMGLKEFTRNRIADETQFKFGLIPENIHPIEGGYIYIDSEKEDMFQHIITFDNNSSQEQGLTFIGEEKNNNLSIEPRNPYFGPLFIPSEPVLQWLVDDIKIINDNIFSLYDISLLQYFTHIFALVFFCSCSVIFIKASNWTMVNILLILFFLRGILFIYPQLLEVQKVMARNFPQLDFLFPFLPAIVLTLAGIIMVVINIIISAPKEEKIKGDYDFEELD